MLGTWQAGQVWAVNRDTHQMHIDHTPVSPDLSDNSLMPYGQQIELTSGYDQEANVAYWQIKWLPPFPSNACQFPFLQFHCTEIEGTNRPDQGPIRLEYRMQVSRDDIASFFPVGATKTDRMYYLRCGGNDEWVPELYVSFALFPIPAPFVGPVTLLHAIPSPVVPAILGTWQAGQVWAVDSTTGHLHIDRTPIDPDLSDNALMRCGQRIEFTKGYDKLSNVAYWQAFWLLPYPASSYQYPFLQYHCTDNKGVQVPTQTVFQLEFTMRLMPDQIADFAPVDAANTGRVYFLRCGGNDEWVPLFYISKDRQRMWCAVGIAPLSPRTDGKYAHYITGIYKTGFQEYHRVAEYKRR